MSKPEELLTVKEVALTLNVQRQTVWNWVKKGKLPAVRLPSGRIRVRKEEIVKLLWAKFKEGEN